MKTIRHAWLRAAAAAAVAVTGAAAAGALPLTTIPALPAVVAAPAATIAGQWVADPSRRPGQIHLRLERRDGGRGRMSTSSDVPLSTLQGLDASQLSDASGGAVRFQIV